MTGEHSIWISKYRPKIFSEIQGQQHIIKRLEAFVKHKNIPHCIFSGPAGVGKCVSPDTLILDGEGNLISIEQAYNNKIKTVMSLDIDGKIKPKEIEYFYKDFSQKTYQIKTSFGAEIHTTPEHPFLTLHQGKLQWTNAQDIKKGMLIASPEVLTRQNTQKHTLKIPTTFIKEEGHYTHRNRWGYKSCIIKIPTLNEEFYYWLGLIFGDGHFKTGAVRFYNSNQTMRKIFKKLSFTIFGDRIEILEFYPKDKCPYIEIRKASTIIKLLEANLDHPILGKKSNKVFVPKELYTSDETCLISFIRGIYETDGSKYGSVIELSSTSKKMIIGLRYLLLNLGIHARIKKNRLILSGSVEMKHFIEKIKPTIKIPTDLKDNNTNIDIMTINLSDIRLLLKTYGISYDEIGNSFSHILERGQGSRNAIKDLYELLISTIKQKITNSLEVITVIETVNNLNIQPERITAILKETKVRNKISDIRADRLKEYFDGKRTPRITNYIKILKKLSEIKLCSEEEYLNIIHLFNIKEKVLPILQRLKIEYSEIAQAIGINPGTTNNIFNERGLSLMTISNLPEILKKVKKIIEKRIFNEQCINILETIDFLRQADIIYDCVKEVSVDEGSEVYDLNVKDTHNFIGGNSPLILHNTTAALIIANEIHGDNWRQNFIELNASDQRGIDTVRNIIKDFCRTKAVGTEQQKIIFLDEADALTKDAQHSLRRMMEQYSETSRFLISCNYSSKIIDPIQSRCAIFRFRPLTNEDIKNIITTVTTKEGLTLDEEALQSIIDVSEGDARKAENILQSCASLGKNISKKTVFEVASAAEPKEVIMVLELALNKEFQKARTKLLDIMTTHGLSGIDIIKQLHKEIWNLKLADKKKVELIEKCADTEFRMVEGSDEYLQLEAFLASLTIAKEA